MKRIRPLSPHLTIYRLPLNAVMSILHRITGAGLFCSLLLFSWWLAALIFSDFSPNVAIYSESILFQLLAYLSVIAITYHLCTGVRHLFWDSGKGFAVKCIDRSNYAVLIVFLLIIGSLGSYILWG